MSIDAKRFRRLVRLAWGQRWADDATDALKVGTRALQRFASGEYPVIPDWLILRLQKSLLAKAERLTKEAAALARHIPAGTTEAGDRDGPDEEA